MDNTKCKHVWAHERWCFRAKINDNDRLRYPEGLYPLGKNALSCGQSACKLMTKNEWHNLKIN